MKIYISGEITGLPMQETKEKFQSVVHRNMEQNYVEVHVKKVKFKHLGEQGVCFFKYNINNGRYVPHDTNGNNGEIIWDNNNHLIKHILKQ